VPVRRDPIIFFSSDSTALYKGDVFRCLALPEGHTIQFRYRTKWVESQIANAPQGVKDRFGLIVFVGGNNQQVPAHQRIFTYEPVRFCTVKEVFFDYDTQQLVTILELEQFVKCQFNAREKPPNFFVTSGEIAKYEPTTWLECVRRLQPYYPHTVFFHVGRVLMGTELVPPTYLPNFRISCFDLLEETAYAVECLYYHPQGAGDVPLTISPDSEQIEIANTFASGAGAEFDKRLIHVKTGLLGSRSARAFTTFSSSKTNPPFGDQNYVQILWQVRRNPSKLWTFGLCVLIGAVGLGVVQLGTKISEWWLATILLLLGGACVAVSAGLLYWYFNKT
jgi:hypothetical protein